MAARVTRVFEQDKIPIRFEQQIECDQTLVQRQAPKAVTQCWRGEVCLRPLVNREPLRQLQTCVLYQSFQLDYVDRLLMGME